MGKYEEALERARKGMSIDEIFPELKESEDERLRKLLVWQVHRNIEDETNDLAQSVYDGIKGHDPDLEESIEDWKKCLAYLEKQKEQKPAEWSEEDEEMLDIVLTMVDCSTVVPHSGGQLHPSESYKKDISEWLKSLRPQPHWKPSEEHRNMARNLASYLELAEGYFSCNGITKDEFIKWLKSLHPQQHWKPSQEQIDCLQEAIEEAESERLYSLQEKLIDLMESLKKL